MEAANPHQTVVTSVPPQVPPPAPRPVTQKVYRESNPQGYVYAISNPAWPNIVKLGMTGDLTKRLAQYQTGSPYRDYVLLHYVHTYDKAGAERRIHDMFSGCSHRGEWFYIHDMVELHDAFEEVREFDGREFEKAA